MSTGETIGLGLSASHEKVLRDGHTDLVFSVYGINLSYFLNTAHVSVGYVVITALFIMMQE